jgi:hypothetical protein
MEQYHGQRCFMLPEQAKLSRACCSEALSSFVNGRGAQVSLPRNPLLFVSLSSSHLAGGLKAERVYS